MPGRPPIDLNQKVRDLLQHTQANPANHVAPIRNFGRRIGGSVRLAELLTELHTDNPSLFTPQDKADAASSGFQQSLTIAGAVGTL